MKKATMVRSLVATVLTVCFILGVVINVFWKDEKVTTSSETVSMMDESVKTVMSKDLMMSSSAEEFIEETMERSFGNASRMLIKGSPDFSEETKTTKIVEESDTSLITETIRAEEEQEASIFETEVADPLKIDPILEPELSGEDLIDEETGLYDAITSVKEYPYETTICYDTEKIAEYKNFLAACYTEYNIEDLPILDCYTNDEWLLAQILQAESGGTEEYYEEPHMRLNEHIAVGTAVLARVRSEIHDFCGVHTISEVLYQKGQYASRTIRLVEEGVQPCRDALLAAKILLRVPNLLVLASDGNWYQVGTNMVSQTGLCAYPSWAKAVIFQTRWHYYARFD